MKATRWYNGELAQNGYCSYAKVEGKWYSVNGICPDVQEVRWEVTDTNHIAALERIAEYV